MKITAEFNSVDEVLAFANTFVKTSPAAVVRTMQAMNEIKEKEIVKAEAENTQAVEEAPLKVEPIHENKEEPTKVEVPVEAQSKVGLSKVGLSKGDKKEAEKVDTQLKVELSEEKPKITKEMVRGIFGKLIKAGRAGEAKEITKKFGASKVPDLKEEDYAAVYKEVEALL